MTKTNRTASQYAAEMIQQGIEKGLYPVGDALPGQRQLAEEMGVGRPAIREAISALEGLGLLTVQAGKGVFVTEPETFSGRWRFGSRYSLEDVYAVRASLESLSVQLITQQTGAVDLDSLDRLVDQLEVAVGQADLAAMATADRGFHRRLAELAGNPLLQEILDTFDMVITESKNIAFLDTSGKNHREVVAEHRAIIASLRARNAEAASRDIKQHILNAQNRAHRVRSKEAADE
jgi:GntR family transcriptional repressor for pyruvate dehydrogenase complex